MNSYPETINRIEFLITLACTGRCKHCAEGEHARDGIRIDGDIAAELVSKVCDKYPIQSVMTFGGEPLLYVQVVSKIQSAAKQRNVPKRQLITNGFISKNFHEIKRVATILAKSGVNDVLLSVDAFHQETIPLQTVKLFAQATKENGIPIRTHPAWLVSAQADNPYNRRTSEILKEFEDMGITRSDGNVIFPSGNALKYLSEYFSVDQHPHNPYQENSDELRTLCVSPNGDLLDGNVYQTNVFDIIYDYMQKHRSI